MSRHHLAIISAFIFLVCNNVFADDIYKWKDENGQVHYASTPPKGSAATKMGVSTTFSEPPAKTSTKTDANPANDSDKKTDAADAEKKDPYSKQQHDSLCKKAKSDIDTLNKSGRLRVKQEDGSTTVMDDKNRNKRMKTMQDMMKKHCK